MGMASALPPELLALIFGYLTLRDLTSTSLVCRFWQVAAFPRLYQTVYVCAPVHLDVLATRLQVKDVPEALSVATHVENLKFDCHRGKLITQDDLEHLYNIIPELTRLRACSWDMNFMPYTIPWNPSLKSIHLVSTFHPDFDGGEWYSGLWQLLDFAELVDFHFQTNDLSPRFNKRYSDCFSSLIECCPTLESIVLNLFYEGGRVEHYSTFTLFTPLRNFHAPLLHTLHLLGDVEPDWDEFASDSHPFWAFLARHTRIENLAIGMGPYGAPSNLVNPEDVSPLLPSLRHFTGPLFFCEALIRSNLAAQLKSLIVMDDYREEEYLFEPLSRLFDKKDCPELRRLELLAEGDEYRLEAAAVQRIFKSAKGLEEFVFQQEVDNYTQFSQALAWAKNLYKITLNRDLILRCAMRDSIPDFVPVWKDVTKNLVAVCPKLELIVDQSGTPQREEKWQVLQEGSGKPSVIQIR